MKKIDITQEIPELIGLIELSHRIEQMEALLDTAKEARDNVASIVIEKLINHEQVNDIWLGEDITLEHKKQHFHIKGLNDDHNDPVKVSLMEHLLIIKDKQTKGTEGEKEQS